MTVVDEMETLSLVVCSTVVLNLDTTDVVRHNFSYPQCHHESGHPHEAGHSGDRQQDTGQRATAQVDPAAATPACSCVRADDDRLNGAAVDAVAAAVDVAGRQFLESAAAGRLLLTVGQPHCLGNEC